MNIIGGFDFLSSIQDFTTSSELDGARDITSTVIGGQVYVFVAARNDDGVQVLRIENNAFVPVFEVTDTTTTGISGAYAIQVVEIGTEKFLYVLGSDEAAITCFRIDTDGEGTNGHLTFVEALRDTAQSGTLPLFDGPFGFDTTTVGGKTFAIVTSYYDDSITVLRIGSDGRMTQVDTVSDGEAPELNLNTAFGVHVATVGNRSFVYAGADTSDNGISAFELSAAGQLTAIQSIETTGSSQIGMITSLQVDGRTFLLAADSSGGRIISYQVAANGTLTERASFDYDAFDADPRFFGVENLEPLVVDGVPFVVASFYSSDAVVIYAVAGDGSLSPVAQLQDASMLAGATGLSLLRVDGRLLLLATAFDTDRATLLEIGAQDDALVGTLEADQIVGLGGGDDLIGRSGNDTVFGGSGDDVLSGRTGNDVLNGGADDDVLIGGLNNDTLQGGEGADILAGGLGRDALSYGQSAAGVNVNLATLTANGGDAAGDILIGFENLTGSARNDTLVGDGVANELIGGGGADSLTGGDGADTIDGGTGNDTAAGGVAADQLLGGDGNDVLAGDEGNDDMRGGNDNDALSGGTGNDTLRGEVGNDTLTGGAGDDIMAGGAGRDMFVFADAFGADEINDFVLSQDRLDFRQSLQINSLAEFNAAAITFSGNTLLSLADGSTIVIAGVTEAQLTASNFLF